ncbi:MAG TPA: valine--tRNA ligase [Stellaceae bacterium]|jgi:valyl-tRNA synthetase|nr:valine--tRNA ligase [Stellaceae bacterium]
MLDKTFDPAAIQAAIYESWEKSGAFACHPDSAAQPYCIMMPPPNVTGSLHMGHALTFTLQDILTRYHRMKGRDTLWQPGTDHAGIATQMVVERDLEAEQSSRLKLGREKFIERVWQWKAQSGGTITRQLRSLGASPDWSRERFTMDEGLSAAVRRVFVQLHREGLIYRDKRLVNWDPKLHTAISDLEVESRETKGSLWYLKYPIEGRADEFITVATTRPETMLGDTGVAVHPEDERYKHLIGHYAVLPLVGRRIPIVGDEYADPTAGSGAVKITPAHDFNDFEVGRRHNLPMVNIFDRDAKLNDEAPQAYRGMDRFAARKQIVADLEVQGLVAKIDPHTLMVPYGDRSGVVIEPWLSDQWYCDAATLAKEPLAAVERGDTVFVPKSWENTYFSWLRNIQPWCISRQLWWGHQIPAWYGPDGAVFVAETEAEALAAAAKHYGREADLKRDPDVLDTWFSSALWPFSTLGWPERTRELQRYYPTDVLVTGFDIIFFWVARMMMMGCKFMGQVPFKTVYIHALVRDERGQKMSKSKGNIIDPLDLIARYGTDALRFTLTALAAQGRDIKLAESRLEGYRNFATKLWNATRYAEMNGCQRVAGFDPANAKLTVNRWIASAANAAGARVVAALEEYKFNEAADALYQFTWGTFCDWYIEFSKPILTGSDEAAKAETRAMTIWVIERIVHLLHPIMPYITETLWKHIAGESAVMLITAPWPQTSAAADEAAVAEMEWVVNLISAIRTTRSEMNVPAASELAATITEIRPEARGWVETHGEQIRRLARLKSIATGASADAKTALQIVVEGTTVLIDVAGAVDFAKERGRLQKEVATVRAELDKIAKKLGNEQFMTKAKPEAIEEQRERQSDYEATLAKLTAALARIGA